MSHWTEQTNNIYVCVLYISNHCMQIVHVENISNMLSFPATTLKFSFLELHQISFLRNLFHNELVSTDQMQTIDRGTILNV